MCTHREDPLVLLTIDGADQVVCHLCAEHAIDAAIEAAPDAPHVIIVVDVALDELPAGMWGTAAAGAS